MPQLIEKVPNAEELVLRLYGTTYDLSPALVAVGTSKIPLPKVGEGGWCAVYALNEQQVLAIDYGGELGRPMLAQRRAHFQNIANLLYPEHFPRFQSVFPPSVTPTGLILPGGSIRERIRAAKGTVAPNSIKDKVKEWRSAGIPLRPDYFGIKNFLETEDGRIVYVDTLDDTWVDSRSKFKCDDKGSWNIPKLEAWLKAKKYDELTADLIVKSAKRAKYLTILGEAIEWWMLGQNPTTTTPHPEVKSFFDAAKRIYKVEELEFNPKDVTFAEYYLRLHSAFRRKIDQAA